MVPEQFAYDRIRETFSWEQAQAQLPRLPRGGLNIAHVALDAHILAGHGDDAALVCVAENGATTTHTYADLTRATARCWLSSAMASSG